MSGAYVAKPEAAPDPPDVPDGWSIDWEHPGPFPPGYEPDYSHVISGDATVAPGGASSNTVTLYDHVSYQTTEPTGSLITWTATINGVLTKLRVAGGGDFASSVVSSYSDLGSGFYGASASFEFDIDEDNVGDNIVLTSLSTVDGYSVTDSYIIAVDAEVVKFYGVVYFEGSPAPGTDVTLTATGLPTLPVEDGVQYTVANGVGYYEVEFDFAAVGSRVYNYFANNGPLEASAEGFTSTINEPGEYNLNITLLSV